MNSLIFNFVIFPVSAIIHNQILVPQFYITESDDQHGRVSMHPQYRAFVLLYKDFCWKISQRYTLPSPAASFSLLTAIVWPCSAADSELGTLSRYAQQAVTACRLALFCLWTVKDWNACYPPRLTSFLGPRKHGSAVNEPLPLARTHVLRMHAGLEVTEATAGSAAAA